MKQPQGSGHTKKHARSSKHAHNKGKHNPKQQPATHHHHQKQHVHTVTHHPKKTKRGLAITGLDCCAAEALAASLRLTGRAVSDADVFTLYRHTVGGSDAGASIWETLDAAYAWGLGGIRPVSYGPAVAAGDRGGLLLGVDLPGPHTVCAQAGLWWSWGRAWCPHCWFPDAVLEEAWEVTWPS